MLSRKLASVFFGFHVGFWVLLVLLGACIFLDPRSTVLIIEIEGVPGGGKILDGINILMNFVHPSISDIRFPSLILFHWYG